MAWAKANPKDANCGPPANGATPHFVGVMLCRVGGLPPYHIPYKGAAPRVSDWRGGQVQSGVNALPDALQHPAAGQLRLLAVNGAKRSKLLPHVRKPSSAKSSKANSSAGDRWSRPRASRLVQCRTLH
jgi:tripartite-type tricarboxylate transporter receptor subunit TctC